jgi:hypothetical protein
MLTPEIIQKLIRLQTQLDKPKHFWQQSEIAQIYEIYNLYHHTRKQVTTCGACVTNTTNEVRKIYQEYKTQYATHDREGDTVA